MPKIVIVGGGIAGIAAANHLISNGIEDILILEAKDCTGGRIQTQKYGNGVIELGAQWIHGEDDNSVFELAKIHDLIEDQQLCKLSNLYVTRPFQENKTLEDEVFDDYFFTPSGKQISNEIAEETCYILDKIFDSGDRFFNENIKFPLTPFKSIAEFAEHEFKNYLQDSQYSDKIKEMQEGIFKWRLTIENADNACQTLYDSPIEMWGAYTVCPGKYHISLKHGFRGIVDILSRIIPEEKFIFNTPVKCIYWDQNSPDWEIKNVRSYKNQWRENCEIESGYAINNKERKFPLIIESTSERLIKADYVIVTCSLGVLKENAESMFKPKLPKEKHEAISKLGFGTVDKIYLEFEEIFWEKDCAGIQFVWIDGQEVEIDNKDHGTKVEWWKAISGFDTVEFHPKLLCGWIAGYEARIMEQLSDEDILVTCCKLLTTFCHKEIPKPIKLTRSKWGSDPYLCGSYSFFTMGSSLDDVDCIGLPLPNTEHPMVLFAGEATHKQYFSTTHGALSSGIREAKRIIHHYQNTNKL